MDLNKIGKFISDKRKEFGLTQSQLAEKLFVTDRVVSKWERGKSLPNTESMVELCKIFNISLTELINGETFSSKSVNQTENQLLALIKEKERLENSIARREKLLSNENYVAKAPQNLVEQERKTLEQEKENLEAILAKLEK
jgi:transcriptional regulator with XRE-family HTH domain